MLLKCMNLKSLELPFAINYFINFYLLTVFVKLFKFFSYVCFIYNFIVILIKVEEEEQQSFVWQCVTLKLLAEFGQVNISTC